MSSLRLSRDATRGLLAALARANGGLREGCQRIADWFRSPLRWTWAVSIGSGLRILQQKLTDVFAGWTEFGRAAGSAARIGAAVSVIYFQDLMDTALDEFERQ